MIPGWGVVVRLADALRKVRRPKLEDHVIGGPKLDGTPSGYVEGPLPDDAPHIPDDGKF